MLNKQFISTLTLLSFALQPLSAFADPTTPASPTTEAPCPLVMAGTSAASAFDNLSDFMQASQNAKVEAQIGQRTTNVMNLSNNLISQVDFMRFTDNAMVKAVFENGREYWVVDLVSNDYKRVEQTKFMYDRFDAVENELNEILAQYKQTKVMATPELQARFAKAKAQMEASGLIKPSNNVGDEMTLTKRYIGIIDEKLQDVAKEAAGMNDKYQAVHGTLVGYTKSDNPAFVKKAQDILDKLSPKKLLSSYVSEAKLEGYDAPPSFDDMNTIVKRFPKVRRWLQKMKFRMETMALIKKIMNFSPSQELAVKISGFINFFLEGAAGRGAATTAKIVENAVAATKTADAVAGVGGVVKDAGAAGDGTAAAAAGATDASGAASSSASAISDADKTTLSGKIYDFFESVQLNYERLSAQTKIAVLMGGGADADSQVALLGRFNAGTDNNFMVACYRNEDYRSQFAAIEAAAQKQADQTTYNNIQKAKQMIQSKGLDTYSILGRKSGTNIAYKFVDTVLYGGALYLMAHFGIHIVKNDGKKTAVTNRKIASEDVLDGPAPLTPWEEWQLDSMLDVSNLIIRQYLKEHPELKLPADTVDEAGVSASIQNDVVPVLNQIKN